MSLIDQINFSSAEDSQVTVFKIINAIQNEKPGQQVAAAGMLFLLLCEKYKAKPRDVLDKAAHILYNAFSEGRGEHIRATKMYLEKEL